MRRLRGGAKLAGVRAGRRRCSGAWGRGESKRVRGKDQGEPPSSGARERKERRALSWPGHGGGEVAAARRFWAAWRACTRPAEQLGWRRGPSRRRVEASAMQEGGPGATQSGGRHGDAPATAETEGQAGGGRQGPKHNFQNFRDLNANKQ